MSRDFERLDSQGHTIWALPLTLGNASSGQVEAAPDGSIVGVAFNDGREGFEIFRFYPQDGRLIWHTPVRWAFVHSAYFLAVHIQLRDNVIVATASDVGTTVRGFDMRTGHLIFEQAASDIDEPDSPQN